MGTATWISWARGARSSWAMPILTWWLPSRARLAAGPPSALRPTARSCWAKRFERRCRRWSGCALCPRGPRQPCPPCVWRAAIPAAIGLSRSTAAITVTPTRCWFLLGQAWPRWVCLPARASPRALPPTPLSSLSMMRRPCGPLLTPTRWQRSSSNPSQRTWV